MRYLLFTVLLAGCEVSAQTTLVNSYAKSCEGGYKLPPGERVFSFSSDKNHDYAVTLPAVDMGARTFTFRSINGLGDRCFKVEEQ